MSDQIDKLSERKEGSPSIDRRKMLKSVLAAGGAITAAAFLDGKWLKPVVKTGISPVHAQSTCPFVFFLPWLDWDDPSGIGYLMAVLALDKVPPDPGNLLEVSGPISFKILSHTGFATFGPPDGQSGTMTDGIWPNPPGLPPTGPPIESFNYTGVEANATVTVEWTFNGCKYIYVYDKGFVNVN